MNLQVLTLAGHQRAIDQLNELITAACPEIFIRSCIDSIDLALKQMQGVPPDIVFLDLDSLDAAYLQGLEVADQDAVFFVLCTETEQKLAQISRFNSAAGILKPLYAAEIGRIIERFKRQRLKSPASLEDIDRILSNKRNSPALSLAVSDGILFIPLHDIQFIKADGPYSEIHYEPGKQVLIAKPLKEFTNRLNGLPFDRVHHSYLVNLSFVEKMHRDGYLILRNQQRVDVSRSNRQRVVKMLLELNRY